MLGHMYGKHGEWDYTLWFASRPDLVSIDFQVPNETYQCHK